MNSLLGVMVRLWKGYIPPFDVYSSVWDIVVYKCVFVQLHMEASSALHVN